ncbi:MAG: hypothetical protein KF841_10765 [Phycisphaerae bacterium]|nr:hypothetical protein [Phycisphaerae bacterium]
MRVPHRDPDPDRFCHACWRKLIREIGAEGGAIARTVVVRSKLAVMTIVYAGEDEVSVLVIPVRGNQQ